MKWNLKRFCKKKIIKEYITLYDIKEIHAQGGVILTTLYLKQNGSYR